MFLLLGSGLGGLRQCGCIQSKRVCVFARAPGGATLGFDSLIVEFGRAGGKKVGPSHLTLTSPVNARHWAAILEALLRCSWAHKSRAAMSFSALSPAVSGSRASLGLFFLQPLSASERENRVHVANIPFLSGSSFLLNVALTYFILMQPFTLSLNWSPVGTWSRT